MISAIHCVDTRNNNIEKTQHILEPNIEPNIKATALSDEDVKRSALTYAGVVPKNIANDILRRIANLTISVNLDPARNDTLVDSFQHKLPLKIINDGSNKEIVPQLSTPNFHDDFKPKLLKTKVKPIHETRVTKLQLKFLDEAMRPQENNFTRSVLINNKNDTIFDEKSGIKVKVRILKQNEDINHENDGIQTQYVIVNNDNKYTTENVYLKEKAEMKNGTEDFPRRNVPGFNIVNLLQPNFKARTDHEIESENVQFLPIQYHVPVLSQFQINQAPLSPISPPRQTLPKYVPVYQSENMPLHFHAAEPMYASHLDTISQGSSQQNQIQNLENYFTLRDSNQYNELKGLERSNFGEVNEHAYLYQQFGVPIPGGHSVVDEGPVSVNPSKNINSDIGDTRRGILNKNAQFLDAHIKIPKNLFELYQSQVIETLKDNYENKNINDLIAQFPQIRGNVSLRRKGDDLKAERNLQVTNSTNSLGIDTLIKQLLLDPGLAKERTENLFTKLISILGPEFSTYFGEKHVPAGNIDNEIKKLQNTLETLRKWREFSKNTSSTETYENTTKLPIANETHLKESMSKESHLNNETQAPDTNSQTHKYKTITLNTNVTTKAPIIKFAEFLNASNIMPKIATTYLEIDTNKKQAKPTAIKPDYILYNPLQLEKNNKDLDLQDGTGIIKQKKATYDEIKKSLDRFTMERKRTFTSEPRYLEFIPEELHYEGEQVGIKEIQPDIVKNRHKNRTSTPHLGLIGKVLNENYLLLSQQSNKNKTTSALPETIEIQGNDEDIIDPKYISENPEVFDSLRQQTEMMGKLLLNYEKNGGRNKTKTHNQSRDNNMDDFEALINKLEVDVLTKNNNNQQVSNAPKIKKIYNAKNSSIHTPKVAKSNEKSFNDNKKIKYRTEISTENKKSSKKHKRRKVKHTEYGKETVKLTKEIHSKDNNDEEIATEKLRKEIHSKESNGEEISTEKPSKEIPSEESSRNERVVPESIKTSKNKTHMSRSELKKVLLRNPDLRKILRHCKLQKRKNKLTKKSF